MTRNSLIVLGLVACAGSAFAVPFPEVEPNQTKGTATPAIGLVAGDTLTGSTTGTSTTTAGAASADTFRVKTAARPLGIYRNRLALGAATAFSGSIRGLTQTAGVPNAGTDTSFQSSSSSTLTPARYNQWYGFGKQEEIYYRVTGSTTTTVPYSAVFSSDPVTPIVISGAVTPGSITIGNASGNTTDTSWVLYDSNFNPIDNAEDNNPDLAAVKAVTLTDGTYYVAFSNYRTTSDQGTPAGDDFRTAPLLDFPNAVANSSTTTLATLNFQVSSSAGTIVVNAPKPGPFDVSFIKFTVATPTSPTPIALSSNNQTINRLGSAAFNALITTSVTPGAFPASSGLVVSADLTSIGGAAVAQLFDDGTNGDATANDGIYSRSVDVTATAAGVYPLPLFASDTQLRTASATFGLTLTTVPVINLGSISGGPNTTATVSLTAGQPKWYKFTTTFDATDPANYLDIWTTPVALSAIADTEIAVYSPAGALIATDDDDAQDLFSALSFGRILPNRAAIGNGTAFNGRDGALAAGEYYVAVVEYNAAFTSPFGITTNGIGAGDTTLNIASGLASQLSASNSATTITKVTNPGSVPPFAGLLSIAVNPAQFPDSTGTAATVNLTSVGGSAAAALYDDGTNGDVTAGDNTFSLTFDGTAVADGVYSLPVTVSDAQARTASATITLTVRSGSVITLSGLTLDGVATNTQTNTVPAGQVYWYGFTLPAIADPNSYLDIHTLGSVISDTEIGLYDNTGALIVSNDDFGPTSLKSALSFGQVAPGRTYGDFGANFVGVNGALAAGTYYLAYAQFNTTFGATGFNATTTGATTGAISVSFIGTAGPAPCLADIAGGPTGGPDGIVDGNDFIEFINAFGAGDLLADVAGGETGGPDGIVDGNDFIAFINAFGAGC